MSEQVENKVDVALVNGNGKPEKKRYSKKIKTMVVEIEEDDGGLRDYTLKELTGSQVSEIEKFKKPLMDGDKMMEGAANAIMDKVIQLGMYDPDNKPVTLAFTQSLSIEAKVGLSNDICILSGMDKLAKETAKNASAAASGSGTN